MWEKVNQDIGKRLGKGLWKLDENVDHTKVPPSQVALVAHRQ